MFLIRVFFLYFLLAAPAFADCIRPDGKEGEISYNTNFNTFQGCSGGLWRSFHEKPPDPCDEEPLAIGTQCLDDSVYAGDSPDGNVKMYVARCDVGQSWNGSDCTGTRSLLPWNNGNTSGYVETGFTSPVDGDGNTAGIILLDSDSGTAGTQPHQAAQACADLNVHGHSDWYLPARDELDVMYVNRTAIGSFDTSGLYYWSSSEATNASAWYQRFSDGSPFNQSKNFTRPVRCARHE